MSNTKEITRKRIEKEKLTLQSLDPSIYNVTFSENSNIIDVEINQSRTNEHYSFSILLSDMYPFKEPQIQLHLLPGQSTLINTTDPKPLETFFKRPWTPNITWKIIVLNVHKYMSNHIKTNSKIEENTVFDIFTDLCERKFKKSALFLVLLIAIAYRVLCSFGGYSGVNDAPDFGDYEAQRHWMELTLNLHPSEWYIATPDNDLNYWRIDYPPVSAYLSWICGYISSWFESESMELFKSRGYETLTHKLFMRSTVLICDILILMTGTALLIMRSNKKYNFQTRLIYLLLILLSPLLILIDHGHFQYNCVTLGFTIWGLYLCGAGHLKLGGVFFTLALNTKQMALYYAIPFFCFIAGTLYKNANLHSKGGATKAFKWSQFVLQTLQVGFFVIATIGLLWYPWMSSLDTFLDVLKAIFPVKRGLYQLKVASFWCATDILIKWQKLFSSEFLVLLSMGFTLAASLPSAILLFKMPKLKYFKIALFNISMAFFFFSYHVHEKTILLPLMMFILSPRYFRNFYVNFVLVATFTNYHMLVEDKLKLQYFVIALTFAYFAYPLMDRLKEGWNKPAKTAELEINPKYAPLLRAIENVYTRLFSKVILGSMVLLTILDGFVTPPEKYPFVFHLFFALIGFAQFFIVFVYSNLKMLISYNKSKFKENEAVNFGTKEAMGKNE